MRMILTFELNDKTKMNIVCDRQDKASARSLSIMYSQQIFNQRKFVLRTDSKVVDFEKWSKSNNTKFIPGEKTFSIAVIYNNQIIINQVNACGIKSAYNNFKYMYGINEEVFAFIYDESQIVKKKSALLVSKKLMTDRVKTNQVLGQAVNNLREIEGIGKYAEDLQLLFSMIQDYVSGAYKQVPINLIIKSLIIILYFVSPINLSFEAIPVVGQCDDLILVGWLLGGAHDDIQNYKKWQIEKQQAMNKLLEQP